MPRLLALTPGSDFRTVRFDDGDGPGAADRCRRIYADVRAHRQTRLLGS